MHWPKAHEITNGLTPDKCRGLGPEDRDLLARHIAQNDLPTGRLWVDCHIGPTPPLDLDTHPELKSILPNYQRRIDLIIETNSAVYICEIKPAASFVALGQALYYEHLVNVYMITRLPLHALILTDAVDPDLHPLCRRLSVQILELRGAQYVPRGRPT